MSQIWLIYAETLVLGLKGKVVYTVFLTAFLEGKSQSDLPDRPISLTPVNSRLFHVPDSMPNALKNRIRFFPTLSYIHLFIF